MQRPAQLPSWWPYAALFLFALLVRAVYFLEIRDTDIFLMPVGDGYVYAAWADEIRKDWVGREIFYQAPLYPYFMAAVHEIFSNGNSALRVVQFLLGAVSCVLLALAGRSFISKKAGLVAGALLAVYAPSIFFEGLVQKPALDLLFVTMLLMALGKFQEAGRARWALLAGAALGFLSLARENALLLFPIIIAWICIQYWKPRPQRALRIAAMLALAALIPLAPVTVRNAWVGGELVLTTSQFGPNFYIGNHPRASGTYEPLRWGRGSALVERLDATELAEKALGHKLTPSEVSRYWTAKALDYIAQSPGEWMALTFRKWLMTWNAHELSDTEEPVVYQDRSLLLRLLWPLFNFGVIAPLAAAGILATWKDRKKLWLLYLMLMGIALSVTIFFVLARYRFPMVPILLLFAAAGLLRIFELAKKRDGRRLFNVAALVGICAVLLNWRLMPEENPRAMAYYNLGVTSEKQANPDAAARYYRQALESHPSFTVAHVNLGTLLGRQNRLEEAIEHFHAAIQLKPDDPVAHNNLGNTLLAQGNVEAAIEEYRAALKILPDMPQAKAGLTRALQELDARQKRPKTK